MVPTGPDKGGKSAGGASGPFPVPDQSLCPPANPERCGNYLDAQLVSELQAALRGRGIAPPTAVGERWCDFDLAQALPALEVHSYTAALQEFARAKRCGTVPGQPGARGVELPHGVEWFALSVPGLWHYEKGTPSQDACVVEADRSAGVVCGVVADGVSQAPLAQYGARILGGALARVALDLLADTTGRFRVNGSFMNVGFLGELHHRTTRAYLDLCAATNFHPEVAQEHFLPTTLQLLIVTPEESAIVALADGVYRWGDRSGTIAAAVERPPSPGNYPPLLERHIFDEARRQRARDPRRLEPLSRAEQMYVDEARAFKIVAYGSTGEVVPKGVEMGSDGAFYTDVIPAQSETLFPLVKLVETDRRAMPDVETAVKLLHIVHKADLLRGIEQTHHAWLAMLDEANDPRWDTATRLSKWIERLGPGPARADAMWALREVVATLPRGEFKRRALSATATQMGIDIVLSELRPHLRGVDFGAALEPLARDQKETIIRIATDIVVESARSQTARTVATKLDTRWVDRPVASESVGVSLGEAVRLLAQPRPGTQSSRDALVVAVAQIATAVLREDFQIAAPLQIMPVCDDLTWLVIRPREQR